MACLYGVSVTTVGIHYRPRRHAEVGAYTAARMVNQIDLKSRKPKLGKIIRSLALRQARLMRLQEADDPLNRGDGMSAQPAPSGLFPQSLEPFQGLQEENHMMRTEPIPLGGHLQGAYMQGPHFKDSKGCKVVDW